MVVDYSSPNVAKPMHVGHVRSTVIGESLSRIFAALGHKVIRDNHLGDWGSQFGMILWGWKNHRDEAAYAANPVAELARLYKLAQARIKPGETLRERYGKAIALDEEGKATEAAALFAKLADGTGDVFEDVARKIAEARDVADATRVETVKLHAGDYENRVLWEQFMPHCLAALQAVYDRLDIHHDVHLGESFYDPMLAGVVEDLEAKGLAVESEGATVVFSDGFRAPFMVRKSDGAYNYATTDLATIRYRKATWDPDLLLYVVDHRQGDHFKQLFAVAKRWGYDEIDMEHVAFGTVLGQDRRPYKTRDGDVVGLESLLDEAIAEARKVVDENSAHLPEDQRRHVAEVVGLGAIKYADLSQNRLSDYVFDMAKMVALNGNTATYLQYAYARIRSIFRKGGVTPEAIRQGRPTIALSNPAERGLAVRILRYPETLEFAASPSWKPNILADYLFDLASAYSTFNEECPVLKAESPERRDSRLGLIDVTAWTLKSGRCTCWGSASSTRCEGRPMDRSPGEPIRTRLLVGLSVAGVSLAGQRSRLLDLFGASWPGASLAVGIFSAARPFPPSRWPSRSCPWRSWRSRACLLANLSCRGIHAEAKAGRGRARRRRRGRGGRRRRCTSPRSGRNRAL